MLRMSPVRISRHSASVYNARVYPVHICKRMHPIVLAESRSLEIGWRGEGNAAYWAVPEYIFRMLSCAGGRVIFKLAVDGLGRLCGHIVDGMGILLVRSAGGERRAVHAPGHIC